jgi:hypothetical protein
MLIPGVPVSVEYSQTGENELTMIIGHPNNIYPTQKPDEWHGLV